MNIIVIGRLKFDCNVKLVNWLKSALMNCILRIVVVSLVLISPTFKVPSTDSSSDSPSTEPPVAKPPIPPAPLDDNIDAELDDKDVPEGDDDDDDGDGEEDVDDLRRGTEKKGEVSPDSVGEGAKKG